MKKRKQQTLEAAGWNVGTADAFLKLSADESRQVAEQLEPQDSWVAVSDDVATRHAIWHITRAAIQLDGMSNVVSPETISTRCRVSFPRHKISRTARVQPELSNAHFCLCCEHDLRIPEDWTLEPLPRLPDYALLTTSPPVRYMATIDFGRRGIRSGYSTIGKYVGEEWNRPRKKYGGRGWRQQLVDDAVAHLQEVPR
jgi:hypothetical protein